MLLTNCKPFANSWLAEGKTDSVFESLVLKTLQTASHWPFNKKKDRMMQ